MRLLILGVDANGRSCIVEETEAAPAAVPGVAGTSVAKLFSTSESPPPPCPPGLGKLSAGVLPPGLVQWFIVSHEPHRSPNEHTAGTEPHYRNAIDLVVVLEGGADMLLWDGPHPVRAGDCIVMAGTDHGLRPGPEGCRLMSFAIGTPPPA